MKKRSGKGRSSRTKERGTTLLVMFALVVVLLFIVVLFLETPTGHALLQRIYG
ncbi:hypothetical protein HY496_03565, partial [Candidatus Woesearchaeota archaeon]|nr:hypothetical protein [Candidatus Woesearchaeota archaeon]